MAETDKDDKELQIAAVLLWRELGHNNQKKVAERLRELFPQKGAFDKTRVNKLCRMAINAKLAKRPQPVELVPSEETERLEKAFRDTERRHEEAASVKPEIERYCIEKRLPVVPIVTVVPGSVYVPQGKDTSEFSEGAAKVAVDHMKSWSVLHPGRRLHIGVTWGRQLHYAANSAVAVSKADWPAGAAWFMPLVGLPLGGHRSEIQSSSEIARSLSDFAAPLRSTQEERAQFDLQLVPAYLPENEFSSEELGPLYKLLGLMEGWSKVFGTKHMLDPDADRPTANAPAVYDCDFIWSSVSDFAQPFGFGTSKLPSLIPFATGVHERDSAPPQPVADCGGIPLWADGDLPNIKDLEASFVKRWTGVRRRQWLYCVDRGVWSLERDKVACGAVLFAPTADKAQSVLQVLRDGLANILILGRPCADKLMQILNEVA